MNMGIISADKLREAQDMAENPRQFRAAVSIVENSLTNGTKTNSQILENAGYSRSVVKENPSKVTKLPSFRALLDKLMPDQFLVERHSELVGSENEKIALSSIDLAYRVKGHLRDESIPAGASLLAMMLGQAQIDQPTIYADVEVETVKDQPTVGETPIGSPTS